MPTHVQPHGQSQYPQQYPAQYPPQQQYQPQQPQQQFPRESVTKTGMSAGEIAFHWTMIICTCGFWWPVYAGRKHKKNRTSVTRYR
jgi:hypothetical protein